MDLECLVDNRVLVRDRCTRLMYVWAAVTLDSYPSLRPHGVPLDQGNLRGSRSHPRRCLAVGSGAFVLHGEAELLNICCVRSLRGIWGDGFQTVL